MLLCINLLDCELEVVCPNFQAGVGFARSIADMQTRAHRRAAAGMYAHRLRGAGTVVQRARPATISLRKALKTSACGFLCPHRVSTQVSAAAAVKLAKFLSGVNTFILKADNIDGDNDEKISALEYSFYGHVSTYRLTFKQCSLDRAVKQLLHKRAAPAEAVAMHGGHGSGAAAACCSGAHGTR